MNNYKLFPFYFAQVPYSSSKVLIANDAGEFLFIEYKKLNKLVEKEIVSNSLLPSWQYY